MPRQVRALLALGIASLAIGLAPTEASAGQTVILRDGVSPTPAYAGTQDLVISNRSDWPWSDTANYNSEGLWVAPPGKIEQRSLLYFDVSSLAPATSVETVELTLTRVTGAVSTASIYEVLRPWTFNQATWHQAQTGQGWTTPGAGGLGTDRGTTLLGTVSQVSGNTFKATFTVAGRAVVQNWINNPAQNHGMLLLFDTGGDRTAFYDPPSLTPATTPLLSVARNGGGPVALQRNVNGYVGSEGVTIADGTDPKDVNWNSEIFPGSDGNPNNAALIRFDLSAIPPYAQLTSVDLLLNVANVAPVSSYPAYELLKAWDEAAATYNEAQPGVPWETPGALGPTDHASTPLFIVGATPLGPVTFSFTAAGVAATQRWASQPASNHGFIIQDYSENDGFAFRDRTEVTPANRPALQVSYIDQRLRFEASSPSSASLGQTSGPFVLRREVNDGSPVGGAAPAISVTVGSDSTSGQLCLTANPVTGWSSSISVTFALGASQSGSFYFRDGRPGTTVLTASHVDLLPGTRDIALQDSQFLRDDFESGTLLWNEAPTGKWGELLVEAPVQSLGATGAAAHRGQYGLNLHDTDPSVAPSAGYSLRYHGPTIGPDAYFRGWVRVRASNASGNLCVMTLSRERVVSKALAELCLDFAGGGVLSGWHGDGASWSQVAAPGAVFPVGQWRLVELAALGMGTSSGARRLWIDGTLAAEQQGLDWSAAADRVTHLKAGASWADDQSFVGDIDFDNLRASTTAPASRLTLQLPASSLENGCAALTIALQSSTGAPAPAPYDVDVGVQLEQGAAQLFSDAACTTPTSIVRMQEGASTATGWFSARAPGTLALSAQHLDFFAAQTSTLVSGFAPALVFLSAPETSASCGQSYGYSPALNMAASSFELVQSDQPATVDVVTGALQWLPQPSAGAPVHFEVRATSGTLSTTQRWQVDVNCAPRPLRVGCDCSETAGGAWLFLAAFAAVRLRFRATGPGPIR